MKQFTSVVLVLALCLVGCSQSQIVTNLQFAVDAAEVAFPIVAQQANLSPALASQIDGYLQGVNTAITKTAPILASTEPTAQKVAEVSSIFASVAAPRLPPGTPQAVVSAITAVANAVAHFLASVEVPAPKALGGQVAKTVVPTKGDLAKLDKIAQKAHANLSKLRK